MALGLAWTYVACERVMWLEKVEQMQHAITVHDVLVASGIAVGVIVALAVVLGILAVLGSAMKD